MNITLYRSQTNWLPVAKQVSWGDLIEGLRHPRRTHCTPCAGHACTAKYGSSWSPVQLRDGATRRASQEVEYVTAAVFDLDGVDKLPNSLHNYVHIVHATHGDTADRRHLRLILALSYPVLADQWAQVWLGIVTKLGLQVDSSARDLARLYFLPSRPLGASYFFEYGEGESLNPKAMADACPVQNVSLYDTGYGYGDFGQASEQVMSGAREWLSHIGPAVEGEKGDQHTFFACAGLLHDYALSISEAAYLLLPWASTCAPPWSEAELLVKLTNAKRYAKGVYGSKRLALELDKRWK